MYSSFSFQWRKPCCSLMKSIEQLHTISSTSYLKDTKNQNIVNVIKQNTEITKSHLTPEITLRLITSDISSRKALFNYENFSSEDPFWGFYWPGGQVLSRYILDHPELFEDQSIIDIGCGCGATAIAAAKLKMKNVIANDIDPIACVATAMNAEINNVKVEILQGSILKERDISVNCILMGDMFYEEIQSSQTINWLNNLYEQGKRILIGDPSRLPLQKYKTRKNFQLLAEYKLPEHVVSENPGFAYGYVWCYSK